MDTWRATRDVPQKYFSEKFQKIHRKELYKSLFYNDFFKKDSCADAFLEII